MIYEGKIPTAKEMLENIFNNEEFKLSIFESAITELVNDEVKEIKVALTFKKKSK